VPGIPDSDPVARWIPVSPLWRQRRLSGARNSVPVRSMQKANLGDGRNRLSGPSQAADHVVPGHMVLDEPEERRLRIGYPADPGAGKLPDGVAVVAQTEKSYGQA